MSAKCDTCGSKMVKVYYKMKREFGKPHNRTREFNRCSKSIGHSYTEESLACVDIAEYEAKVA